MSPSKSNVPLILSLTSLLLLFTFQQSKAQINSTYYIKCTIKNEAGGLVKDAYLLKNGTNTLLGISINGLAEFELPQESINIAVSHISYQSKLLTIKAEDFNKAKNDTLYLQVILKNKFVKIDAVEINAKETQLAYTREFDNIKDYEFYEDLTLLLFQAGNKNKLRLVDAQSNRVYDLSIRNKAQKLIRDCFNNLQLAYHDSIYQIRFTDSSFYLMPGYSIKEYNSTLALCKASMYTSYVIGYEGQFRQEVSYYLKKEEEKDYLYLGKSVDALTQYKAAQFYAVAKGGTLSAAASQELGELADVREFDRAYTYFKYVSSRPLHSPLYAINESYLFFNHQTDSLHYYSPQGKWEKSIPIQYHKLKGWQNSLLVDYTTHDIYALFKIKNRLQLRKLSIEDGTLEEITPIDGHSFPEKIMIREGVLYYLYRSPFKSGSPQNLFKKRLD